MKRRGVRFLIYSLSLIGLAFYMVLAGAKPIYAASIFIQASSDGTTATDDGVQSGGQTVCHDNHGGQVTWLPFAGPTTIPFNQTITVSAVFRPGDADSGFRMWTYYQWSTQSSLLGTCGPGSNWTVVSDQTNPPPNQCTLVTATTNLSAAPNYSVNYLHVCGGDSGDERTPAEQVYAITLDQPALQVSAIPGPGTYGGPLNITINANYAGKWVASYNGTSQGTVQGTPGNGGTTSTILTLPSTPGPYTIGTAASDGSLTWDPGAPYNIAPLGLTANPAPSNNGWSKTAVPAVTLTITPAGLSDLTTGTTALYQIMPFTPNGNNSAPPALKCDGKDTGSLVSFSGQQSVTINNFPEGDHYINACVAENGTTYATNFHYQIDTQPLKITFNGLSNQPAANNWFNKNNNTLQANFTLTDPSVPAGSASGFSGVNGAWMKWFISPQTQDQATTLTAADTSNTPSQGISPVTVQTSVTSNPPPDGLLTLAIAATDYAGNLTYLPVPGTFKNDGTLPVLCFTIQDPLNAGVGSCQYCTNSADPSPCTTTYTKPMQLQVFAFDPNTGTTGSGLQGMGVRDPLGVQQSKSVANSTITFTIPNAPTGETYISSATDNANNVQNYNFLVHMDLSQYTPTNVIATALSTSTIRYAWQAPPGAVDHYRFRWNGTLGSQQPFFTLQDSVPGSPFAIDYSKNSKTRPASANFQTSVFLDACLDASCVSYASTGPVNAATLSVSASTITAQTTNSITGSWAYQPPPTVTQIIAGATDSAGDFTPSAAQSPNSNPIVITVKDLPYSNTSYALDLEDDTSPPAQPLTGSSMMGYTLAAKPGLPTAIIGGDKNSGLFMRVWIATDTNAPDSSYAIKVISPAAGTTYYLNTTGPTTDGQGNSATPLWQSSAAWSNGQNNFLTGIAPNQTYSVVVLVRQNCFGTGLPGCTAQVVSSSTGTIVTPGDVHISYFGPPGSFVPLDNVDFDVPASTPILLTFNTMMNTAAIQNQVQVTQRTGTAPNFTQTPVTLPPYTFTNHNNQTTVVLSPSGGSWATNAAYTITVPAGLPDNYGYATAVSTAVQFMTSPDPAGDTILSPLDTVGLAQVQATQTALSSNQLGAIVPRIQFLTPAHALTAPGVQVSNPFGMGSLVQTMTTAEVLFYPSTNPNVSRPIGQLNTQTTTNGVTLTLCPQNTISGLDPGSVGIYQSGSGAPTILPNSRAATNGCYAAAISQSGLYFLAGVVQTQLNSAYAWPVPFRPASGHTSIHFTKLAQGATIKVYTIMGELVKTLQYNNDGSNEVIWNPVTNDAGENVASGVYIYQIKNQYSEQRGKLIIVR